MSTRRTLLAHVGCATAAGAALLPPTAVIAAAEDPHAAWHVEVQRLRDLINDTSWRSDEESDVPFFEMLRLEELIATTPATTPAGVAVQIRLVHENHVNGSQIGETEEAALASALTALAQLGARA